MRLDGGSSDDRLLRLAGLALPAAVWVLGVVSPPRSGLTPTYLLTFTGLLAALALADRFAPGPRASRWRRLGWLALELVLCALVVRTQSTLVRPALIYLLPASRALLLFGPRAGLVASLSVWLAFAVNIGLDVWPDRLNEYPNYLIFLLPPYVVAVVLTRATLLQAADRRRVEALYEQLQAAHDELRALHATAREVAIAEERNRLAREIHDSLAHYLTVVNVQLEAAEKLGDQQAERALVQVRRARRLTLDCLQEVRRSVAALRAASLEELSLPNALRKMAAEFAENTGLRVDLEVDLPEEARIAPEAALALYRSAQEGLTNVQRHAAARCVRLRVSSGGTTIRLAVEDDGVGPAEGQREGGFGLLGLRERVELLGGQLAFGPGEPAGSRLSVIVPLAGRP